MSTKRALGAALAAAVLAALPATPASANVQVGASGWQWGNPLPQGNTVRAMSFAGTTGYAAGDFGTLLKTSDGGASWGGLPVGTFQGLSVVRALDADTVFAGGGCVARRSVDGGRSFTAVRFTPVERGCRVGLRDLSFVTSDLGWLLLDDGSVFVTTDGGTQFAPRTAIPGTRARGGFAFAGGIFFLDARVGYATSGGTIFQTLDGGISWRAVATANFTLARLWFADGQHGFAVGDAGTLLRTDDGGNNWAARAVAPGGQSLTSIRCNTSRVCILTTSTGMELIRTDDYGEAGGTVVTPSTEPIYAAAFASPHFVVAAGQNGASVISGDTGVTFAPIGGRIGGAFTALRVGGEPGTAYAPGTDGTLAMTSDSGRTWNTEGNVPTSADLLDVSFPTATDGYALDVDGGLFHTSSGGRSWETLGTGSTRRPRAVLATDPETVLVVGPRGIRRSVDAGETFDQLRSRAVLRAQLRGVGRSRVGGAILAWGPSTLVRSTDGGRTWTALRRPGHNVRIAQVAFEHGSVGLLVDGFGRVYRTTTAGRRWMLLTSVGSDDVTGVAVSSPCVATLVVTGFAGAAGGYLLRTDDGGATWQPQFVVNEGIGGRGIAAGNGVGYVLAGGVNLLFSTTGGVAGDPSALSLSTKRRQLPRAGRITVTGRLRPAGARAQVVVSMRVPGGDWKHQSAAVATNGTFATAWRVPHGTTTFVAQWTGDFKSAGAGSRPLTVTVGSSRARRR
jgi:photosystem II stability/assembly factor-like uncharacterized protein